MIQEGDTAPDFTLQGYGNGDIETFSLTDALETGPVILTFYIYDYSPVCTDQVCEVNDMEFITFNDEATVFGISTDGPYSHREFATDKEISYPLLTDDGKQVYEQYGLVTTNGDATKSYDGGSSSSTKTGQYGTPGWRRITGTSGRSNPSKQQTASSGN